VNLTPLIERLPPGTLSQDPEACRAGARDWSPLALLRDLRGDEIELPAAVVSPSGTEEVSAVLAWANQTGTPVAPRGGGSGVVEGTRPGPDWIVLDLSRMDRILELDEGSDAVHVQAGIVGDRLEAELAAHRLTLGHYPQSITLSTVGGWIASSAAGQASAGFGAIEDLLLGVTAVLADGRVLELGPVPRSAAGPDLRRLLVGSEGTLAVITEAWLACSPLPPGWTWSCFAFDDFDSAIGGARAIHRAGTGASIVRAYDLVDSALTFGSAGYAGGCLMVLGFPSDTVGLDDRLRVAAEHAAGRRLDASFGEHWWARRNDLAATYRRIMGPERIFGPGTLTDTVEVAALWSRLPRLYAAVRDALVRHCEAVACHLSHVYRSGASLYFTILVRGPDDRDVEARYLAAWAAAVRSCIGAGGTMTHHHGVGRLKVAFLPEELGEVGVDVLRSIKGAVDPRAILNPGALLPETGP
jgi:alkyldihydroxyacetonephosphate synthase